MKVNFNSAVTKNNVKYYYVEIVVNEDYSFKKFLTKEEAYILQVNGLLKK